MIRWPVKGRPAANHGRLLKGDETATSLLLILLKKKVSANVGACTGAKNRVSLCRSFVIISCAYALRRETESQVIAVSRDLSKRTEVRTSVVREYHTRGERSAPPTLRFAKH